MHRNRTTREFSQLKPLSFAIEQQPDKYMETFVREAIPTQTLFVTSFLTQTQENSTSTSFLNQTQGDSTYTFDRHPKRLKFPAL